MKLDYLRNKIVLYLFPVLTFIVVFSSSLFLVKPWIGNVEKLRQLVKEKEASSKKINEKLSVLSERGDMSTVLQALEDAIPSQKDPISGLTRLKKAVIDSGMTFSKLSVTVGEVSATESAKVLEGEVPYKLEVSGSRDGLLQFLSSVYTSSPLISIGKLTMDKDGAVYTAKIDATSYYYAVRVKTGSADTPLPRIAEQDDLLITTVSGLGRLGGKAGDGTESGGGRENPFAQ